MKKSEMLKLLERDIKDAAGDLEFQARMVLSRMISCGMKPPHHPDRTGDEFKSRGYWSDDVYEWEEEDSSEKL